MIAALSKERMTHLCEEITNFPFHPRQYHTITVELQENQVETFEGYPVPKDCVSQSMKVKFGTE
ncbi:hypothetical protein OUZ56_033885 [Daphnia magna]|uniref:Uncharacterized protein n=1 Tax=Daphnia magna TaxID=35525 RepID=A0ABR0BB76_9CRUS|nr:hypothetical protein OUZ56_033885 [Daphnia magna]